MCHSSVTSVLGGACACSTVCPTGGWCCIHKKHAECILLSNNKAGKPSTWTITSIYSHIVSYRFVSPVHFWAASVVPDDNHEARYKQQGSNFEGHGNNLSQCGMSSLMRCRNPTVTLWHIHKDSWKDKVPYICNVCNYVICESYNSAKPHYRMKMYEGEPCSLNSGGRAIWPQLYVMTVA